MKLSHNKAFKTDSQRSAFSFGSALVFKLARFEVGWWRCSLLNAALGFKEEN